MRDAAGDVHGKKIGAECVLLHVQVFKTAGILLCARLPGHSFENQVSKYYYFFYFFAYMSTTKSTTLQLGGGSVPELGTSTGYLFQHSVISTLNTFESGQFLQLPVVAQAETRGARPLVLLDGGLGTWLLPF